MTENERTARAFAEQFTPLLTIIKTERINNMPVPDAWAISYHDSAKSIGITAVAYQGGLHAFIEAAGTGDIAEHAGQVMAKALGLFKSPDELQRIENGTKQLPEAFAHLTFDGLDELPVERDAPETEKFLWLYRAACLRVQAETAGVQKE